MRGLNKYSLLSKTVINLMIQGSLDEYAGHGFSVHINDVCWSYDVRLLFNMLSSEVWNCIKG